MAQRGEIRLTDDLDQGPANETVQFGLDGVTYEIDLSSSNAEDLRGAFVAWVGHARRIAGRRTGRATSSSAQTGRPSGSEVRAWAAEQGMEVSGRGRVPAEVRKAYDAAH
ncbi:Lsr2 family protein [Auraticoccus sp. F435]|uniref:Lsr2 family protein n=1 Tax=Auraticoccus cholistanensis TaxID=2656650 RepID=A0A6A9UW84_9ACTN|nr:Lsr2 family protein [Auraticoccus cholistanensis]MVA75477.1 Lsr2 family protein [Auraticoccus cholistanensis]